MRIFFKRISFAGLVIALVLPLSSCARHKTVTKMPSQYDTVYGTAEITSGFRAGVYHSVAPGETLWRIAKMYDVDIKQIQKANNIGDVTDIEIGTRLYIPAAAARKHVITLYPSKKWKYIIIHHSATDIGNSQQFNTAHKNRGWSGVGYDFVIDNGTCGKADGQIETSPRWIKQQDGAHCKAGGMNSQGIGICLVGNFSQDSVSPRQLDSLVFLVDKLRDYYKIPDSRIMGHGQVPGASTECPGTRFPWATFRKRLSQT